MTLWQRIRGASDAPAPQAEVPEQPREEKDAAGTGLPSRSLPKIVGALACVFALYVAFFGGKHDIQQPAAPPPPESKTQANARPHKSQFASFLQKIEDRHAGQSTGAPVKSQDTPGNAGDTSGSGGLKNPLDGSLPTAANLKDSARAKQGNIAASSIIALRGGDINNDTGHNPEPSYQPRAPTQPPRPDRLKPLTRALTQLPEQMARARQGAEKPTLPQGRQFLQNVSKETGSGYGPTTKILAPLPGAVLYPGTVLPATTVTAVNTQLPGTVIAQTTADVYGRKGHLAVPGGSRLVGRYDSQVRNGQTRILVAFKRVIFPDGQELVLQDSQSVDSQGASGTKADVNSHFFKMLGASLLVAMLDEGVSYLAPNNTVTSPNGSSFRGPAQAGGKVFAKAGSKVLDPYTNLKPTGTIPIGTGINVLVNKTVVIPQHGDDS